MRLTISFALFFALVLFGLSACSKEKKIERSLQKKDGIWDVVNIHNMHYSYDSLISESTTDDHAAFIFLEGGKFEWENGNITGTWLNTDDDLVITLNESGLNSSNVLIFRIIEESKDEMTLERAKWVVDMGVWKNISTYRIKRRK